MRICLALLAGMFAFAIACLALAAETPIPPSPTDWVTDNASFISPATRDELNQRLANYNHATGHQVIVWIGTTTGDAALEDWTIRAFTAWKVGRKGLDDGVALFIFAQDRKVRIEVGYGLEGQLTDAQASQIIRNEIVPELKAGNPDDAVRNGVSGILAALSGEQGAQPAAQPATTPNPWQLAIDIFFIVLVLGVLILRWAYRGGYYIGSGWRGAGWGGFIGGFGGGGGDGGGGDGGGGFSGGGGMGGGGGASGSW